MVSGPLRVLVTGWRDANDREHRSLIWRALDGITFNAQLGTPAGKSRRIVVVHGACPYGGADRWAAEWAERSPYATAEPHPAEGFGPWPACGPKRNSHMVGLGADLCLGFPGPRSRGTWDCLRKAVDAGIVAHIYPLVGIEVDD